MERLNQYAFYTLGKVLERLMPYDDDVPPMSVIFDLTSASHQMGELLEGKPMPLGVSRGPAQVLRDTIDRVLSEYCLLKGEDGKPRFPGADAPVIPSWRWGYVKQAINQFETVFREELGEATSYYVPRRGIFFTPALVDAADESFPREIISHIPQKTRQDWKDAGRCLAFNLLSAAGFHVARAVEGTLEAYYQMYSGKPGMTLDNWGRYLQALEDIQASKQVPAPSDRTLQELRQLKDDYRNPIVHPRVVLTESDAKMLFNNGESVIIAMAQEMANAAKAVQPALALVQSSGLPSP